MKSILKRVFADESGATAIEYGLIAALIVIAMMTGLQSLGGGVVLAFAARRPTGLLGKPEIEKV